MATIQTNIVFEQLSESKKRISIFQGGSRSGKSYNIVVWIIRHLAERRGLVLSIVRKTLPSIKGSIMRDFFDVMDKLELYNPERHNKTENTYTFHGNLIEFVSVDQPQKIRGRKRDLLFINEANELSYEDWQQLVFRTTGKIIIDFNPSDQYHWLYDKVMTRDDAELYISTYKDNPFLSSEIVNEIERLKDTDENYWRVYGLGQRAVSSATIYTHWQLIDDMPTEGEEILGLDFGFNHPSSLVRVKLLDDDIYCEQLIYKSSLTTDDLIQIMDQIQVSRNTSMYCDYSRPEAIEEIQRAGYNAKPAIKSVIDGINSIKSRKLFVTKESTDMIKEFKAYKWKETSDGKVLDEPVKFNDDALDALRYSIYSHIDRAVDISDYLYI